MIMETTIQNLKSLLFKINGKYYIKVHKILIKMKNQELEPQNYIN